MSIFDNLKKDAQEDVVKLKAKAAETEQKLDNPEGRKIIRYIIYGILALVVLMFGSCVLRGCSPSRSAVQNGQQFAQVQPAQQPVQVINQGSGISPMEAAAMGALAGYVVGQSRMPDGSVYQGTPQQQVIVKKYYVQTHPQPATPAAPAPVVAPPVVPVAKTLTPAEQKSLDQKAIKASADKAAEAEKAKMVAEQAERDRQSKLKDELRAKQAARVVAKSQPAPSAPKSSFSSFSKSASSNSSRRK